MRGSSGGFFTHKYRIVASSLLAPDTLLISSIIHSFFHYIYSHFSSLLSLFCIRQAVLVSFLWTWFYSYCLFHLSAPEFYDTLYDTRFHISNILLIYPPELLDPSLGFLDPRILGRTRLVVLLVKAPPL